MNWLIAGTDAHAKNFSLLHSGGRVLSYMKRDGRLSGVLHLLLHMSQRGGAVTSEALAKAMNTNPVVVRRTMAGLRECGYVRSEKGHGGGWTLACDPTTVTLRDIYFALGAPSLLAIGHRAETPGCLVEQAVNAAMGKSFRDAEALLLSRLGDVTLAKLSADVGRLQKRVGHSHPEKSHAKPHRSDRTAPRWNSH